MAKVAERRASAALDIGTNPVLCNRELKNSEKVTDIDGHEGMAGFVICGDFGHYANFLFVDAEAGTSSAITGVIVILACAKIR